jgi:AraC-like DNA-binding protein
MSLPDPLLSAQPLWLETRVASGRGNVGTGMFDRVFFVDVFDGPQGLARVRSLTLAARTSGLSQVISTGHEVALEEDRSAMLILPQSGRLFCAVGTRDLVARPGQAMLVPRGRRRTVTLRDGNRLFRALVLRVADPAQTGALANGATLTLADLPDLAAATALIFGLTQPGAGWGTGRGAERGAGLAARLRAAEALLAAALAGLESGPEAPPRLPAADRARHRAEALLREQAAEDIAIRDVADRVGVSMRQLQHLFSTAHGLSPLAWLTRLRLEQAHLQLKGTRPAPSVTEAALSAGFTHLGRFPAQYRARFGTLPSVGRGTLP